MTRDEIETTARLIHEEFCRRGSGHDCRRCRAVAERIARVAASAPIG